jgi:hypothetical protein
LGYLHLVRRHVAKCGEAMSHERDLAAIRAKAEDAKRMYWGVYNVHMYLDMITGVCDYATSLETRLQEVTDAWARQAVALVDAEKQTASLTADKATAWKRVDALAAEITTLRNTERPAVKDGES